MAYYVDRVVISDAYSEPDRHYKLLRAGHSRLTQGRRPSMRFLASAQQMRGGIESLAGREAGLFEDMLDSEEQQNEVINTLREEVRSWRDSGYQSGTAIVTRRLLEWWFERDEERKAVGNRFFFCQREAIETVIYLYEVKNKQKMPETGDLIRYALKLATGTGKTVVMALLIAWSTLHKRKVSGSSLSSNFLILVPNLTVRDRVSGIPRGDGLLPDGEANLYKTFDIVPPDYAEDFRPDVMVENWQGISFEASRDDWIGDEFQEEGRFIPASVLWALQRRSRQDPNAVIRRFLNNWRDLIIINDEAHHVYGEKKVKKGEEPGFIRWSRIIERISKAARIGLVVDLSATPWYGSGSPKPGGTLYEWLVCDFSVFDAFESGLVKVVRLPDSADGGHLYLDLWESVSQARTKEEYLSACRGAIAEIYADWKRDYLEWEGTIPEFRMGPSPAFLVVAYKAQHAEWLFEHLTSDYELFRNPDDDDPRKWVTVRVDSAIFDAQKGKEAILREMVNTVGGKNKPGEYVRCIVNVNMLSEGWDVKSVTHILGLRAFGSPLLTEQIIGRGLRRTNYEVLNQPLEERPEGTDETVDAFGIPFLGIPVEKRKRPRSGSWGHELNLIEKADAKSKYRIRVPNVRAWAVGVTEALTDLVRIDQLPEVVVNPKETPPEVRVRPVVGGQPEAVMTLDEFRKEYPILKTSLMTARELLDRTSPGESAELGIGPTFDELLDVTRGYLDKRLRSVGASDKRDAGIYYWRQQILNILETAIRSVGVGGVRAVPILGNPEYIDTEYLRHFQWTGIVADGKKCHTSKVPCHTDLEKQFAEFLDRADDVIRYFKNERFGFSLTYYDNNRPRQYYPDFIVITRGSDGKELYWIAETKGEIRQNTKVKQEAAELWCTKMSKTSHGTWRYMFAQQVKFEYAMNKEIGTFSKVAELLDAG